MVRTIAQVNKEINYLTVCYQRLTIKTTPYRERMKRLKKEKEKLLNLSEKELAKIERNKQNQDKSELIGYISDPNTGKDVAQPTVISDKTDYINY